MSYKESAAEILDVKASCLKEFSEQDTFNPQNHVEGVKCLKSNHLYGTLVIFQVNGKPTTPQIIYGTPKIKYPVAQSKTVSGKRIFHWPRTKCLRAYKKYDGSNALSFSYADAYGKRYSTFKTRLTPFIRNNDMANFFSLWRDVLVKYPTFYNQECVLSGNFALSYEMYGWSLPTPLMPMTMAQEAKLEARLLFGINQQDHSIQPPEVFSDIPQRAQLRLTVDFPAGDNSEKLIELYDGARNSIEESNEILEDGRIKGEEGLVFYILTEEDKWTQWKAKAPSVETLHWANFSIPLDRILPTAWNALESCDELTTGYVCQLLREEFPEKQIDISIPRIERAVEEVKEQLGFQTKVKEELSKVGLEFNPDNKIAIMRELSKSFGKKEMKKVYSVLKRMGVAR